MRSNNCHVVHVKFFIVKGLHPLLHSTTSRFSVTLFFFVWRLNLIFASEFILNSLHLFVVLRFQFGHLPLLQNLNRLGFLESLNFLLGWCPKYFDDLIMCFRSRRDNKLFFSFSLLPPIGSGFSVELADFSFSFEPGNFDFSPETLRDVRVPRRRRSNPTVSTIWNTETIWRCSQIKQEFKIVEIHTCFSMLWVPTHCTILYRYPLTFLDLCNFLDFFIAPARKFSPVCFNVNTASSPGCPFLFRLCFSLRSSALCCSYGQDVLLVPVVRREYSSEMRFRCQSGPSLMFLKDVILHNMVVRYRLVGFFCHNLGKNVVNAKASRSRLEIWLFRLPKRSSPRVRDRVRLWGNTSVEVAEYSFFHEKDS